MKKIEYKKQTAILLACISLLIFGGCALYINGGITYPSLKASFITVGPGIAFMFVMGWLIGSMIDGSKSLKRANSLNYTHSLLDEIMKEEGFDEMDTFSNSDLSDEEQKELEDLNFNSSFESNNVEEEK